MSHFFHKPLVVPKTYYRIRESIMIWPVQDQQWRNPINTLLHCLPIHTANTPQLPRNI